jgi:hypothetical protein
MMDVDQTRAGRHRHYFGPHDRFEGAVYQSTEPFAWASARSQPAEEGATECSSAGGETYFGEELLGAQGSILNSVFRQLALVTNDGSTCACKAVRNTPAQQPGPPSEL